MKISKKVVTMVVMLAIVISGLTPFHGKVGQASGYSSAVTLPMNGAWSSERYITETDDEHWYKITIPSDGEINIRIMSYIGGSFYWTLYNRDLSSKINYGSIWGASETAPKTRSEYFVLSAGTYYYKLDSSSTGKYKLYAQFISYGVNDIGADSYDSPFPYQMGSTITGAMTATDGEDWYKIIIPSDGYYTQKIVSYYESPDWTLYNWDLSNKISSGSIYGGSDTAPKTDTRDFVLSKGIYYVKIYDYYSEGKYLFQFSKLTQSNCSHNYQTTTHYATYFKRGYTSYRCEKCGHTYKADYTPVRKLGQGYVSSYSSYTGKGKVFLSWSTVSDSSGYQIRYSKNRKMKQATVKTVRGQSKYKYTIKKLLRKKRYYIQVRAYKKSGGKSVYGKWSQKKSFKTK
ncbi:MAG: fibronectin type III domain-containing protein [Lachnospiraceae bacterium]|nr:fibronectin type III domain-containing protein [Lachnospiraceae bacterium]